MLLVGPHGLRIVDVEEDVLLCAAPLERQAADFGGIVREVDVNLEDSVGSLFLYGEALQSNARGGSEQQCNGAKGNAQAGTNFQAG
ncbi:hypothetical protein D3C78_1288200 [compost metagenome]